MSVREIQAQRKGHPPSYICQAAIDTAISYAHSTEKYDADGNLIQPRRDWLLSHWIPFVTRLREELRQEDITKVQDLDARFPNWPEDITKATKATIQDRTLNPKSALVGLRQKRAGAKHVYRGASQDKSKGLKWVKKPLPSWGTEGRKVTASSVDKRQFDLSSRVCDQGDFEDATKSRKKASSSNWSA